MSEGFPYADLVVLALIAGFVLLRLRNTLGKQTGADPRELGMKRGEIEKRILPIDKEKEEARSDLAREKDLALEMNYAAEVTAGLAGIRKADDEFSTSEFLSGARVAFEWIFDAFAKGDKGKLETLLAKPVLMTFVAEIDRRQAADLRADLTLVSVLSQELIRAETVKNMARMTVRFVSEQVHVMRNRTGDIVEGDASDVQRIEDEWVFERDLGSRNPNWKIVET